MKVKKLLGVLLAILMIVSAFTTVGFGAQSVEGAASGQSGNAYNLAPSVQSGNILHAFNWRFCDVEKYMSDIASAGFTAVQVSPVQGTKVTTNCGIYACDWWSFYQPINFTIGNALGTEADFKQMCDAAHSYGVKVIVDIVANHVAQADSGVSGKVNSQVDKQLQNYVRKVKANVDDTSRANMVQRTLNGIPDLDTSQKFVQMQVLSLLEDCVDNGADGFRFDAAKHIETPDDGSVASDFWPTVINGINDYKDGLYIYGEILSDAGKFELSSYTKYMNVTNFAYGATVRSALKYQNASSLLANNVRTGTQKSENVYWVESHDNFCDGTSSALTKRQQLLGWASIGARDDVPALYLARPSGEKVANGNICYDQLISEAADTWKSPVVSCINKFKNAHVGDSELTYAKDSIFGVQRGNDGLVLVDLKSSDGNVTNVNIENVFTLNDGTYFDALSGNKFIVNGGTVSGAIGDSGVAVLCKGDSAAQAYDNGLKTIPKALVSFNGKEVNADTKLHFSEDFANVELSLNNAQSGTYSLDGASPVAFTTSASVTIGKGKALDSEITLTVTATNGDKTTTENYTFYKKNANNNTIYFDNTSAKWSNVYVYPVDENGNPTNGNYPGVKMEFVGGKMYKATISKDAVSLKFNEGYVTSSVGGVQTENCLDGRTVPSSVLFTTPTDAQKLTGEVQIANGYYDDVLGMMMWSNGSLKDIISEPTVVILGDADQNDEVSILDVTAIQKHLALIASLSELGVQAADVDASGEITIMDATFIQKYLAGIEIPYAVGKPIGTKVVDPTQKNIVTLNQPDCFKDAISINAYYWGAGVQPVQWPGVPMTKDGDKYTLEITDTDITTIIFVGVYDSAYKNCIKSEEYEISYDTPYTIETKTIKASDYYPTANNWTSCNAHIWSGSTTTTWPGINMTKDSNNDYTLVIPANVYDNMIISNNGKKQSKTFTL